MKFKTTFRLRISPIVVALKVHRKSLYDISNMILIFTVIRMFFTEFHGFLCILIIQEYAAKLGWKFLFPVT
jgi:hypothetical protein